MQGGFCVWSGNQQGGRQLRMRASSRVGGASGERRAGNGGRHSRRSRIETTSASRMLAGHAPGSRPLINRLAHGTELGTSLGDARRIKREHRRGREAVMKHREITRRRNNGPRCELTLHWVKKKPGIRQRVHFQKVERRLKLGDAQNPLNSRSQFRRTGCYASR